MNMFLYIAHARDLGKLAKKKKKTGKKLASRISPKKKTGKPKKKKNWQKTGRFFEPKKAKKKLANSDEKKNWQKTGKSR